jgi:hypothetical protein
MWRGREVASVCLHFGVIAEINWPVTRDEFVRNSRSLSSRVAALSSLARVCSPQPAAS